MKSFGDAGKKPFLVDNRSENVEKADKEKDNAPLTKLERNRVIAILIVTVFSGIFWLIWYMLTCLFTMNSVQYLREDLDGLTGTSVPSRCLLPGSTQ